MHTFKDSIVISLNVSRVVVTEQWGRGINSFFESPYVENILCAYICVCEWKQKQRERVSRTIWAFQCEGTENFIRIKFYFNAVEWYFIV